MLMMKNTVLKKTPASTSKENNINSYENNTTILDPIIIMNDDDTDTKTTTKATTIIPLNSSIVVGIVCCIIIVRICISFQYYSGENNYHGSVHAYGGDYECQRHWMEITINVPIGLWYYYDLYYWGLDYPPLSAYVSYIFGIVSQKFISYDSMELNTSRGYETILHKVYMRCTVLILDILFYFTIVWIITKIVSISLPTTIVPSIKTTTIVPITQNNNRSITYKAATTKTTSTTTTSASNINKLNVQNTTYHTFHTIWYYIFAMIQPSIILIDHGHFQYNTVSLGLSLWSFYYITKDNTICFTSTSTHTNNNTSFYPNCIIGSILFCCSLSFKQMILYYSPCIFFYLLGRCYTTASTITTGTTKVCEESTSRLTTTTIGNNNNNIPTTQPKFLLIRFVSLGITVILCFVIIWWPFVLYGPIVVPSYVQRLYHILRRIIPLQRGLFEGKVANIWCTLSIKPINIRHRIPAQYQPICALVLTIIVILPACYVLFITGKYHEILTSTTTTTTTTATIPTSTTENPASSNNQKKKKKDDNIVDTVQQQQVIHLSSSSSSSPIIIVILLWGVTVSSLSFFLASFQVHEKSLLMSLTPISLLYYYDNTYCIWFSIVCTWTLWHLIQLDRLQVAYVCTILIFISCIQLYKIITIEQSQQQPQEQQPDTTTTISFFNQHYLLKLIPNVSYTIMIVMHILEMFIQPPSNLPDIFPVIWSIIGCGFCCIAYVGACWHLFRIYYMYFPSTMESTIQRRNITNTRREKIE